MSFTTEVPVFRDYHKLKITREFKLKITREFLDYSTMIETIRLIYWRIAGDRVAAPVVNQASRSTATPRMTVGHTGTGTVSVCDGYSVPVLVLVPAIRRSPALFCLHPDAPLQNRTYH
jgi:hypothetical protein